MGIDPLVVLSISCWRMKIDKAMTSFSLSFLLVILQIQWVSSENRTPLLVTFFKNVRVLLEICWGFPLKLCILLGLVESEPEGSIASGYAQFYVSLGVCTNMRLMSCFAPGTWFPESTDLWGAGILILPHILYSEYAVRRELLFFGWMFEIWLVYTFASLFANP